MDDRDRYYRKLELEPGAWSFCRRGQASLQRLAKEYPQSIRISGQKSIWKVGPGVTLGTTLKDLERLNRRPFVLAGFGWDYSGTVVSWEKGDLEKEFTTSGRVIVRLKPIEEIYKIVSSEEAESVMGDQDCRSDSKVMQKINPRVYAITIELK